MQTVDSGEISHLERVDDSAYLDFYQHPDPGSFESSSIVIEPVANDIPARLIYQQRLRPEQFDELATDFHARLIAQFEETGLLTGEPNENTLVISPSITYVTEYDEQETGTQLSAGSRWQNRIRGNTIMEMTWRAGQDGTVVTAIRDGRTPFQYSPVTDHDDRFTDARDSFDYWSQMFASFFLPEDQTATN